MCKVVLVRAPALEKERDDFLNRVDLRRCKGGADSVRLGFQKVVEWQRQRVLAYIVDPPAVVGQEQRVAAGSDHARLEHYSARAAVRLSVYAHGCL